MVPRLGSSWPEMRPNRVDLPIPAIKHVPFSVVDDSFPCRIQLAQNETQQNCLANTCNEHTVTLRKAQRHVPACRNHTVKPWGKDAHGVKL